MRLANEVRPHTFDEVVGQKEIVANIRQQSIRNRFFQGYTLCGQFGSGKTTIARIIQLAVNCHHKDRNGNPCLECDSCKAILAGAGSDIVEIDAASNTGVDSIRSLKEEVQFLPAVLDKKVYIIDEVQRLSAGAFDALLKVLEEPPAHVVFVLCTTEKNKIPKTILSRTAVYNFGCICSEDIVAHLEKVCDRYDIGYEKEGLALIAGNSQGAMRNALSILEQISNAGDVTVKAVSEMLGVADCRMVSSVLEVMLSQDEKETVSKVMELLDGGVEPASMISDMLDMLSDCIVASYGGHITGTQEYAAQVSGLSGRFAPAALSALVKELLALREKYRELPDRSTVICGIIAAFHGLDVFQRVKRLEDAVKEVALTSRSALHNSEVLQKKELFSIETEVSEEETNTVENVSDPEMVPEAPDSVSEDKPEPQETEEYPFPVGAVVLMEGRKFRVDEYRAVNPARTDVVLFDMTAAEGSGYPISRMELLSVFRVKAEAFEASGEKTEETAQVPETEPAVSETEEKMSEDEFFAAVFDSDDGAEEEVPFEEDVPQVQQKETEEDTDLFSLFGIGSSEPAAPETEDVSNGMSGAGSTSLAEEMEGSALLKAAVEFGCDVNDGEIFCRERKDEPVGRILNAFADAGRLTAAVKFA